MSASASFPAPTPASLFLRQLAVRVATALDAVPAAAPRALLLTGSAAAGLSDDRSDLDLIAYHDTVPSPDVGAPVRAALGAALLRPPVAGNDGWLELLTIDGVEVQIAHVPIARWEAELAEVVDAHTPGTITEKAISGLLSGLPLRGADLIAGWQARAGTYPLDLSVATVRHYLRFYPFWRTSHYWVTRDAPLFYSKTLTETCLNLLGVLAGLNRQYFSTFQPTRLHRFAATLPLAPPDLAGRLLTVLSLPPAAAGDALLLLVLETLVLIETHLPEVDTSPARHTLRGGRGAWTIPNSD